MSIRRNRKTLVCLFCRQRKVRCDKKKPCTTCVKFLNPNCSYETDDGLPKFPKNRDPELIKKLQTRLADLETQLNRLKSRSGDQEFDPATMATSPYSVSDRSNTGSGSSHSSSLPQEVDTSKLNVSNLINDNFEDDYILASELRYHITDTSSADKMHIGYLTLESITRGDKLMNMIFQNTPKYNKKDESIDYKNKSELNEKAKSLGLTFFEGNIDNSIKLLSKIQLVLPCKRVIWTLMDLFFNELYPFFPILDEFEFIPIIESLIGLRSYEESPIHQIVSDKKMDFAYLGILMVILRITYLSLFSNIRMINEQNIHNLSSDPNAEEVRFLLNNPVNLEVVQLSYDCVNMFDLINSSNLVVLQLATFVRYYRICGPECGDDYNSSEPQVFSALLLQMAFALGLNREPDNFDDGCKDERQNHLARKLWKLLVLIDTSASLSTGDPAIVSSFSIDVKSPYLTESNCNTRDPYVDRIAVDYLRNLELQVNTLYETFHPLNVVSQKIPIKATSDKAIESIEFFNRHITEINSNNQMSQYLHGRKPVSYYDRTMELRWFFMLVRLVMILQFHFANYYNSIESFEKSVFYLKRSLRVFCAQFHKILQDIVKNQNYVLEQLCELLITPNLYLLVYSANLIFMSLLLKIRLIIKTGVDSHEYMSALYHLDTSLLGSIELSINFLGVLGNRYYAPWKSSKVLSSVMEQINDESFLDENIGLCKSTNNFGLNFAHITEILAIVQNSSFSSAPSLYDKLVNQLPQDTDSLWHLIELLNQNEERDIGINPGYFSNDANYSGFGFDPRSINHFGHPRG